MNKHIFEKMTAMEEVLRKQRGLSYLLSRIAGLECEVGPDQPAAEGIHELSDDLSNQVGTAFSELFESCVPAGLKSCEGGGEGV